MSEALTKAAVRACIALRDSIDALAECESVLPDGLCGVHGELSEAYTLLIDPLSIELGCDARELVRSVMEAELQARRAVLTAQTGLHFPIETKE